VKSAETKDKDMIQCKTHTAWGASRNSKKRRQWGRI